MKIEKILENLRNLGIKIYYEDTAYYQNVPYIYNKNKVKVYIASFDVRSSAFRMNNPQCYENTLRAINYGFSEVGGVSYARTQIKKMMEHYVTLAHDPLYFSGKTGKQIYEELKHGLEAMTEKFAIDCIENKLITRDEFEELYS